jgi:type I restriction enzyme R subunit
MPNQAISASEWLTRRAIINPKLNALSWNVAKSDATSTDVPGGTVTLTEYPTENGPADYALCTGGRIVGIVEAKKVAVSPDGVLEQAERYARGLPVGEFDYDGRRAPFLYATNGEIIHFHDVRDPRNLSRKVKRFHTPAALEEMLGRDFATACNWFAANPNNHHLLRPYQREANTAVEEAIAAGKRSLMLSMATGCGKTFTLVNQVYRLLKSGVARRVLFLVDRRALAAQAVKAFAAFDAEPNKKFNTIYSVFSQRFKREDLDEDDTFDPTLLPPDHLLNPQAKHTFVYVCTIQRMMINLFGRAAVLGGEGDEIDDDAEQLDIPIHAFDVIVADECHRGYTTVEQSHWRNTLDYFDAIRIGLTATPAKHTKAYFKEPVFRYEYPQAVREGFLVDYDAVKLKSDVRMKGVFLDEGEAVDFIDPESGAERRDQLEDERTYDSSEVEKTVTSPDSNRKILEELKRYAEAHEAKYGRFPKTLIFAANDTGHTSHANEVVTLAREVFGRGEAFVQKITGRSDRPLQRIREFRNRPQPSVVVSVDLMSTGVDIPDLEYLVFLRVVKSRILFEQMLGRGTRKGEKYPDKSHFVVFDCFDGTLLKYFKNCTGVTSEPPENPGRTVQQVIDDIWGNRDREYNVRCLVRRLQRIEKEITGDGRSEFAAFGIPDGDIGKFAAQLPAALTNNFTAEMQRLRNPEFQGLLTDYQRRPKTFARAIENEDTVTSAYIFRDTVGQEYSAAGFLTRFAQWVAEKRFTLEPLRVLLFEPVKWSAATLKELTNALTTTPEKFTPERLELAHRLHDGKPGADLISTIRRAADPAAPLLTASERAARAVTAATVGTAPTAAQAAWLGRIQRQLAASASLERADFDDIPIFADAGGWGAANKAFGGTLAELVDALNRAVAS